MKDKYNRRSLLTKKRIREALFELMQQKPFVQISVKDICDLANLNRTTFYLHYQNLDTLLHEVEQNAYYEIEKYIYSVRSSDDKIQQIKLLLDYIKQNYPIFQILLMGNETEYKDRFFQHFQQILKESNDDTVKNDFSAYTKEFILSGCTGLITAWIGDDFRISSKMLAEWLYLICKGANDSISG